MSAELNIGDLAVSTGNVELKAVATAVVEETNKIGEHLQSLVVTEPFTIMTLDGPETRMRKVLKP